MLEMALRTHAIEEQVRARNGDSQKKKIQLHNISVLETAALEMQNKHMKVNTPC